MTLAQTVERMVLLSLGLALSYFLVVKVAPSMSDTPLWIFYAASAGFLLVIFIATGERASPSPAPGY